MHKALPLALCILVSACSGLRPGSERLSPEDIVVALYDSTAISLADFEQQYRRTLPEDSLASDDSLAQYQDFLERYVDFRLKVLQAEAAGYHEREDLTVEMNQYRGQLARPYLLERKVVEPLIQELFDRKQEMVDVSHILLRLAEDASPADTAATYNRLASIVDSVRAGAEFGEMATRYSQDPSAGDPSRPGYRGRLGFYSGGRMVKPFEDRMYATAVDSLSEVFRTQFGYHVLMVHARQPSRPDRRVAHIMIQPRGQSPADSADASQRLDSLLIRLDAGEAFADLAREMSDDRQSASRGGDLDFVSFDGWLPPSMRDEAFALDSVGAVSAPITTQFGQHLVKLLGVRELPDFDDSYDDLKAEVSRLPRSDHAEREFAREIRTRERARVDTAWVAELMGTGAADSVLFAFSSNSISDDIRRTPIAYMGDSVYTGSQFGRFAADNREGRQLDPQRRFHTTLDAFLDDRAIAYEVSALEARDADFRRTMQEFRDGLMLFRLMEDSVWTAANEDTTALAEYYAANAGVYRYPDRTRIFGIASRSDSLIQVVYDRLEAGTPYGALVDVYARDSTAVVRFDTTYVEGETGSIYDRALNLDEGAHSEVQAYTGGRIVLINGGIEPARAKTFDESRAELVAARQEVLEARLVRRLRAEHNAVTYPERLVDAFRLPERR